MAKWLPVVGYEGIYEVRPGSDGGAVRRIKPIPRGKVGKELGRKPRPDGYHRVTLSKPGDKPKLRYMHHLILEAFVGPCPEGCEALHRDDVKSNNTLGNLKWGTRSENLEDCWKNVRHPRGDALTVFKIKAGPGGLVFKALTG